MIDQDHSHRLRYFIITFATVGGLIFAVGIIGFLKLSAFEKANLHAFVTPSNSMRPTLCEGERFFADLAAYSTHSPARGDVIAYSYKTDAPGSDENEKPASLRVAHLRRRH